MNLGLSDQVRAKAQAKYVHPALRAGKAQFSIAVKDLLVDLHSEGFPARNTPQVCSALQTAKFLRENGLEIEGVDGPPSGMSTTVVVRYRVADSDSLLKTDLSSLGSPLVSPQVAEGGEIDPSEETPSERAFRLTEKLRGLMKEEFAAYGGGEAFLRWVRGYDEEEDVA